MTTARRLPLLAGGLVAGLAATAVVVAAPVDGARSAPAGRVTAVGWADDPATAAEGSVLPLRLTLGAGAATEATVRVAGGTVVGLPDACAASTVLRRRSYLSADGSTLVC